MKIKKNDITIHNIPTNKIIDAYRRIFNIDVEYLFSDCKTVKIKQNYNTKHLYCEPQNILGDSDFYKKLEIFPWYYQKEKWEFNIAKNNITKGKILEIGCGFGYFIKNIQNRKELIIEGSEFNQNAVEICKNEGLNVSSKDISEIDDCSYDYIVSFQVLEHLSNPELFFENCYRALKKNGKLILAVPNCNSFIFKPYSKNYFDNGSLLLNLPPHHMNWFNKKSMVKTGKIHGFKIDKIYKEPYTEFRRDLINSNLKHFYGRLMTKVFKLLFKHIYSKIFSGDSLLVIYKK